MQNIPLTRYQDRGTALATKRTYEEALLKDNPHYYRACLREGCGGLVYYTNTKACVKCNSKRGRLYTSDAPIEPAQITIENLKQDRQLQRELDAFDEIGG